MPKRIKYNPADRIADLAVVRMQDRIKEVYAEAERDISRKLDEFMHKFREKDAQYRADVAAGKIKQADYDAWRRGQMFQGEQWKAAKKEMTDQIYRANKTAAGIINGERRVVFQQNANYSAYQIEKDTHGAVNFELYDSATVTRLLREDKKLLPEYKVNQRKDYKWNNRKVNNAVTQSIIQGESIDDLSSRLTKSLESGNRSSMLSFARTAMTGAQNAGRVEAMHDAEDMGIKVQKRWIATLDSRTRDTHAELDGQVVDVDEPFEVDGMEIMFPGDPNADPALVYNCRCTLGWEYPGVATGIGTRADNETGEEIEGMTYKQWEQSKQELSYEPENNEAVAKEIEYGELFPEEAVQITRSTLDDLNKEYPLSKKLEYVGDIRTHRGFDPDEDVMDLHYNHKEITPAGAQYLPKGADGKSGACIEIHKESYSVQKLQKEFDDRYALRLRYGDPMKPPKQSEAFFNVTDTLEGTIRHEYGHALSDDNGVFSGGADNAFRQWQKNYWEEHRSELLAISKYAASHPDEMFAEAFVQVQDTRHQDTLAYKLSAEIMDAFERYRRGEPL